MAIPSLAKSDITTTSNSFNALVENLENGDSCRFWLSYADASWNKTDLICGPDGPQANLGLVKISGNGGHNFTVSGLKASSNLIFSIFVNRGSTTHKPAESERATTKADTPSKVWPGDWTKWKNLKKGDAVTLVTADDWNDFLDRINEVIDYKGGTQVNFSRYKKSEGDEMIASDFNSGAISAMHSIGLTPTLAVKDGDITVDFFIGLENTLNSAK